jgi:hypothetical protein
MAFGFSMPIGIEQAGGGGLAPPQLLPQGTGTTLTVGYTFAGPLTLN